MLRHLSSTAQFRNFRPVVTCGSETHGMGIQVKVELFLFGHENKVKAYAQADRHEAVN
jgi:hypothetical protein